MPGFELFGDQERAQVQDVMDSGVLMRYGFDGMRNGNWKAVELEKALAQRMQVKHAQLVSSGTSALTVALVSAGIGAVSYTHLRAHETDSYLVCRLLLE